MQEEHQLSANRGGKGVRERSLVNNLNQNQKKTKKKRVRVKKWGRKKEGEKCRNEKAG